MPRIGYRRMTSKYSHQSHPRPGFGRANLWKQRTCPWLQGHAVDIFIYFILLFFFAVFSLYITIIPLFFFFFCFVLFLFYGSFCFECDEFCFFVVRVTQNKSIKL